MTQQVHFTIPQHRRGYHLITADIVDNLPPLPDSGLANIFLHHTSAALTINENADPTVRSDFNSFMDKLIPENDPVYHHLSEGADDMPAHLKSSLLGQSVNIPISSGRLNLGIWQGIYLCEFRNRGGRRDITVTIVS